VDAASAAGDITLNRGEAGVETLDADAFTDLGSGYSLVLSIAEMTAARIIVYIIDQTSPKAWLDKVLIVETYGNASAQHPFDLASATVNLSGTTETQIDNVEADTNELQTDWHDGGRLDLLMDSLITAAGTAAAYAIVNSGLGFRGVVTNIPGANQFKIGTLAGIGAGTFTDAVSPWYAYVFRDAGGAAALPQGEYRKVTGYNSADGMFTTLAFTAPGVELGDDMIITSHILANIVDIKAITDTLTLTAIADAIHDETVEGALTQRQLLRLISAALCGELSGAGTGTLTFTVAGGGANRVVATVDASNNRTGVVLSP
jgi:hypothetical protein